MLNFVKKQLMRQIVVLIPCPLSISAKEINTRMMGNYTGSVNGSFVRITQGDYITNAFVIAGGEYSRPLMGQ
jgi:hypothetical protein